MGNFKIVPENMNVPIGMIRDASGHLSACETDISEVANIIEESCDPSIATCATTLRGLATTVNYESKRAMLLGDTLNQVTQY